MFSCKLAKNRIERLVGIKRFVHGSGNKLSSVKPVPDFREVLYGERFKGTSQAKTGMFFQKGGDRNGLLGNSLLTDPEKLYEMKNAAEDRCKELVVEMKKRPITDIHHVLNLIDEVSNQLCLFLDCMEFLRNVHPDEKWKSISNETWQSLHSYLHLLNTDVGIHETLREIIEISENEAIDDKFTEEESQVAELLKLDMEKHGVYKDRNERARVRELNQQIDQLGSKFYQSLHERSENDIPKEHQLILSKNDLLKSVIPLQRVHNFSKFTELGKGKYRLSSYDANFLAVRCSDPSIRQKAYLASHTGTHASTVALNNLLDTRHELSQFLGYESYAQWAVKLNIMNDPNMIIELLDKVHEKASSKIEHEINILQHYKSLEESGPLQVWDRAYYSNKAQEKFADRLHEYFPLYRCLEGFYMICEDIFNVRLEPTPLKQGEGWAPEVRKLEVIHPQKGVLGYIYLDLHYRPNKVDACANFSVRVGKSRNNQKPLAVIVCGFTPNSQKEISLLSLSEVLALFHELGHALHTVLGSTTFQNTSGTRTVIDFVEMPSQFMEHFLYDYRVVSRFAKHYETGEILPEAKFNDFLEKRKIFSGLRLQDTIRLSQLDIALHGKRSSDFNPTRLNDIITERYSCFPVIPNMNQQSNVLHFMHYAAGYYSYLYCKICSHHIYEKYFSKDPFNQDIGSEYVNRVLSPGGSRNASLILEEFLQESPNPDYLIEALNPPSMRVTSRD